MDYLGPLAQAQKRLFRAQGIGAGLQAIAVLAEIFPESRDVIDPDITIRELLDAKGFPAKCTRDDDAVRAIRQTRGQQRLEQEALEQSIQVAKAMPAAGKKIEEGSALDYLLGAESA